MKEGKAWAVIDSCDCLNGPHASADPYLLKEILEKQWGFDGLVMSDWGGNHETAVVQAGNDLEMPTGVNMSVPKLKAALADGSVTQAAVDDAVRRILRTIVRVGLLDGPISAQRREVNSPEHARLAHEAATKGIVLLKNEQGVLPLNRKEIHSIAVIGPAGQQLQVGAPAAVPRFSRCIRCRSSTASRNAARAWRN